MNKRIILAAIIISAAALALTPLLHSTGLATGPLSEPQKNNAVFLQNIEVTAGFLLKLDLVQQITT